MIVISANMDKTIDIWETHSDLAKLCGMRPSASHNIEYTIIDNIRLREETHLKAWNADYDWTLRFAKKRFCVQRTYDANRVGGPR